VRLRPALSPEAVADLEEIRQYTAERFGEDQTRRYMSGLREALEQLASHPDSGREIVPGSEIRCWIHRSYYRVLYRKRGSHLEIGRIVHVAREQELQRALDLLLRRS
jgi:toxin ParE1/3/4